LKCSSDSNPRNLSANGFSSFLFFKAKRAKPQHPKKCSLFCNQRHTISYDPTESVQESTPKAVLPHHHQQYFQFK